MNLRSNLIQRFFYLTPETIHNRVTAALLNHILRGQIFAQQLADLDEKIICIHVSDLDKTLLYHIKNKSIHPLKNTKTEIPRKGYHVKISSNLQDLFLLVTRQEDADRLFFQKRLTMEGETETGLYLRNLIEGADYSWNTHFQSTLDPVLSKPAYYIFKRLNVDVILRKVFAQGCLFHR